MKKTKKSTARKTLSTKAAAPIASKARAQSKATIQVKAKSPAKRKVARKPRFISPEDRLVESITAREGRRAVIPASEERVNWSHVTQVNPRTQAADRKVAGKKPIYPRAHSE
jgi:hypothetical protein